VAQLQHSPTAVRPLGFCRLSSKMASKMAGRYPGASLNSQRCALHSLSVRNPKRFQRVSSIEVICDRWVIDRASDSEGYSHAYRAASLLSWVHLITRATSLLRKILYSSRRLLCERAKPIALIGRLREELPNYDCRMRARRSRLGASTWLD
jgi:hypothetical protein